jgi:hypothetical protein
VRLSPGDWLTIHLSIARTTALDTQSDPNKLLDVAWHSQG